MSKTILSPQEERIEKGQDENLTTEDARAKRARVTRMLKGIRDTPARITIERARLLTESFKENADLPMVLKWAKFLEKVGKKFPVYIGDDELIVGRCGPKGRYSIFYPELQACWVNDFKDIAHRKQGEFYITEEDARIVNEEIMPFWQGKTLYESYIQALPEETRNFLFEDDNYTAKMAVRAAAAAYTSSNWSHDYKKVIERGFNGIKQEAQEKLASIDVYDRENNLSKIHFYQAVIVVCESIAAFAGRYAELARNMAIKEKTAQRKRELLKIAEICDRVPANPARNFHEAVQAMWFVHVFSRFEQLITNHASNGRIDQYLYPLYQKDKETGLLTDDQALELLECLWINMAQSMRSVLPNSAVAYMQGYPHFEHTTIGGQTPEGVDATNELSYLFLQSKKEFPMDYPDLSVRVHSQTPHGFLVKVCELIKEGTGYPKLLNDEEIIPLYLAWGATLEQARDYCGGGCTEIRVINRETYVSQCPTLSLGAALEFALNDGKSRLTGKQIGAPTGDPLQFNSYEDVWTAFKTQIEYFMKYAFTSHYIADLVTVEKIATPMMSCLHDLCMEQGVDLHLGQGKIKGGLSMGWISMIGFGTVIDSLAAIKKLVYDDRSVTMAELLNALEADFVGKEPLRQMCLNAPKYGNCDLYADLIGREIDKLLITNTSRYKNAWGGFDRANYVPVTAHVAQGALMGATPNGRKARESLSEGVSPSQGCDVKGPTASLKSIANTKNASLMHRGARLLNIKLSPQVVAGEEGTANLISFIRTWCDQKFWHLQFNIINRDTLVEAQKHPDKYRNLLVRVAGYSAYFVDLSADLQNEIIARTEHGSL